MNVTNKQDEVRKMFPKPVKGAKNKRGSADKEEKVPSAKKPPKHIERDEFDLEELGNTLEEAKLDNKLRTFVIYRGDEPLTGVVTKIDSSTKLIHIKDEIRDIHKIHFLDILQVSGV